MNRGTNYPRETRDEALYRVIETATLLIDGEGNEWSIAECKDRLIYLYISSPVGRHTRYLTVGFDTLTNDWKAAVRVDLSIEDSIFPYTLNNKEVP